MAWIGLDLGGQGLGVLNAMCMFIAAILSVLQEFAKVTLEYTFLGLE